MWAALLSKIGFVVPENREYTSNREKDMEKRRKSKK